MKTFKQHLTESDDANRILGRNLAAKVHYDALLKANPQAAAQFVAQIKERNETYEKLLKSVKDATEKHLSRTSSLNITSGNNYNVALAQAAKAVRAQFPKLTENQIVNALTRDKHTSTLDIADELLDKLFPELKKLKV